MTIKAYQYDQPGELPPFYYQASPDWETAVTSPDIQREHLFIPSGGVKPEADLQIPAGGSEQKGAVVFISGSGPIPFQAYFGIAQKYVQDVFLPIDASARIL